MTERGTDSISAYAIEDDGLADGPATISSTGKTPYGFDFTANGAMIVTEAFGGDVGAAAASSYSLTDPGTLVPVSASVGDTRSEVCWAAVTKDSRYAFVSQESKGVDPGAVSVIDLVTKTSVASIPVPLQPTGITTLRLP